MFDALAALSAEVDDRVYVVERAAPVFVILVSVVELKLRDKSDNCRPGFRFRHATQVSQTA